MSAATVAKRRAIDVLMSPTMIVFLLSSVLGGIVWGIQVNILGVDNLRRIGALESQQRGQAALLQRTALILDRVEERFAELRGEFHLHEKDAEKWKQEIRLNTERIRERGLVP